MDWKYILKGTESKQLKFLALFFAALYVFHLSVSISDSVWYVSLWFSATLLLILAVGLYYDSPLIISGVATSALLIETVWIIDILFFSFTGQLGIGIATYLTDVSLTRYFLTFYHFFLPTIPIAFLVMKKAFHKHAWVFSSLHLLAVSILTLVFSESNINCVRTACELGVLDPLYIIRPDLLPLFIFNWLAITIIVFIPTQLLLALIIKGLPKSEPKKGKGQGDEKHYPEDNPQP